MENQASMNEFLEAFGIKPEATGSESKPEGTAEQTTDPVQTETVETSAEQNNDNQNTNTNAEVQKPEATKEPDFKNKQQAETFAAMRVQNKQYAETLQKIAGVLGIKDTKNTEEVVKNIQTKLTEVEAKNKNVPVELLQRLNELEQRDEVRAKEDLKMQTLRSFQNVKVKFGLTDDQLNEYALDLQKNGINPFEQPVNLETEYLTRNFDRLIKEAEEKGTKAEQARAVNATNNGSVPNGKQNPQNGGNQVTKVDTIKGLDSWLDSQKV